VIECINATHHFSGGGGVEEITFHVSKGEFVILQGPTGAGKSTLLRLFTGEIFPQSGQVRVGQIITSTASRAQISALRKQMGVVFQDGKLLPDRDCLDNVSFGLWVRGVPYRHIRPMALKILLDVGLARFIHKRPNQLSGGEQQRLAIARAMVNDPLVLLADEPLAHLDPDSAQGIMELLARVNRRGTAIIMASHREDGFLRVSARVLKMHRGRIVNS
jgi:cell division transport system ATP-binding protein